MKYKLSLHIMNTGAGFNELAVKYTLSFDSKEERVDYLVIAYNNHWYPVTEHLSIPLHNIAAMETFEEE